MERRNGNVAEKINKEPRGHCRSLGQIPEKGYRILSVRRRPSDHLFAFEILDQ